MTDRTNYQQGDQLDPDEKGVRPADQAEGERDGETSAKVDRTPGQAEGTRDPDDQSQPSEEEASS
ncbi:MAG: hypothetical protein DIU68_012710 [Chloroflexota bacterium]|nr:MAG: hypothetical protein DIU68_19860 [Chloroflexota bacterium]